MPVVVFKEPIKMKNGTQTVAVTIPKCQYCRSAGMFVMPKTLVTKVSGRKKIETRVSSLMLYPSAGSVSCCTVSRDRLTYVVS